MRIGYSFWGFLGDHKQDWQHNELSTPDGNAAYSWALIYALQEAGHEVFLMQTDRDWPAFQKHGKFLFDSFSPKKRFQAYMMSRRASGWVCDPNDTNMLPSFPELDLLLLEWRFPIPGRNTEADRLLPAYQPDLERQSCLIEHYRNTHTRIVVWDLDYKFTTLDEATLNPHAVLETATDPKFTHRRIEPPIIVDELLQHPTKPADPKKKLVYVGSRYERDDIIDRWIKPVSERFPGQVHFYGNWDKTVDDCRSRWPDVKYHGRITMKDFASAYSDAVACPLLAKKEYLERGFITPRIWEALLFGTIPVGLDEHSGIRDYLPEELIALDAQHLGNIVQRLSELPLEGRDELRRRVVEKVRFMDASNLVRVLEKV